MKYVLKYGIAMIVYAFLIGVDLILGIGFKDQWDNLNKWSRK